MTKTKVTLLGLPAIPTTALPALWVARSSGAGTESGPGPCLRKEGEICTSIV